MDAKAVKHEKIKLTVPPSLKDLLEEIDWNQDEHYLHKMKTGRHNKLQLEHNRIVGQKRGLQRNF